MSSHLAERTSRRTRVRRAGVTTMSLLLLLMLTGCSQETTDQWKRLGLPEAASDRAPYMHDLWIGSWIAAGITGVFVWGLILWACFRYRRRGSDELPTQVRYNLPIEVLYTVAPVIIVAVLFFFTVEKQNKILDEVDHPTHDIFVTAQQWSWTFNYLDESAVGGSTDVYDTGTAATLPDLWLVKGESVAFTLHSADVIHDFWVPSFYFKRDVVPGRDQTIYLTPTKYGTFAGRCAELCGYQHSRMLFNVRVVTRAEFDAHMKDLQDAGQVGKLVGGRETQTIDGLEASTEEGAP